MAFKGPLQPEAFHDSLCHPHKVRDRQQGVLQTAPHHSLPLGFSIPPATWVEKTPGSG